MDNIDASSPEMESENNASADARDLGSRVACSISKRLKGLPRYSTKCCIYKVPEKFRRVNEEAYTPQLVSIGPLHHGSVKLHFMEDIKLKYFRNFMSRTNADLLECVRILQHSEDHVCQCYQETIVLNSDAFVGMILVDAIFILELFMRNVNTDLRDIYDEIFNKQWMISGILHDMLLLENQLPFFVLQDLYNYTGCNPHISFLELCYNYFKHLLHGHQENDMDFIFTMFEVRHMNNVMHLVDFVRAQLEFPRLPEVVIRRAKFEYTRSITELQEAGVLFRREESCFPFDITFTKGILKIPRITVQESTETFFRILSPLSSVTMYLNSQAVMLSSWTSL